MARRSAAADVTTPDASMRLVVLHGNDDYLIATRSRLLADSLKAAHGEIEQFRFDGDTATLAQVLDELRSYGLMQTFKLVIVDQADAFLKRDGIRPAMERYAASPMPEATLLLRSSVWHKGKLDTLIEAAGAVINCDSPSDARAAGWCMKRSQSHHRVEIEADAAAMLVARVGNNLNRLDAELGKLSCMVEDQKPITADLVRQSVGLSREEQAWSLQSVLLKGDPRVALRSLEELMSVSRAPTELISWSIADLLRKIHSASSFLNQGMSAGEAGKALRLWGPDQSVVLNLAKAAPPARWAQILQAAIDSDLRSKTGLADGDRAVEALTVLVADSIGATLRR